KDFIDILPTYGSVDYSRGATTSTTINKLKYRGEGDAVLSFPMVWNKELETYTRSPKPTILNEKDLSPENLSKLWEFIIDNVDRLTALNSRYVYVFQFPDGTYKRHSPVVARPVEQSNEALDVVFQSITSVNDDITLEDQ